jgi:hypothetical protein
MLHHDELDEKLSHFSSLVGFDYLRHSPKLKARGRGAESNFPERVSPCFMKILRRRPAFAGLQDTIGLAEPFAFGDEKLSRVGGVELEHVVVARHHPARASFMGELRGLVAIEVPATRRSGLLPLMGRKATSIEKARSFLAKPGYHKVSPL